MYEIPIWVKVGEHPRLVWSYCGMCAAGLRDEDSKVLIRKSSEIWASPDLLIKYIKPLQCNGKHTHADLSGTYQGQNKTHLARHWTWTFAATVAAGVAAVVRQWHNQKCYTEVFQTGLKVPQGLPATEGYVTGLKVPQGLPAAGSCVTGLKGPTGTARERLSNRTAKEIRAPAMPTI